MTWMMPAEFAPQDRIWMAFPRDGYTLGDDAESAELGRSTWAAVANAASGFEPVTMVVDPSAIAHARRLLSSEIELIEAPLDDFWMRDIGPTFVLGSDETDAGTGGVGAGSVTLGAVDWVFNGWGANSWSTWARDAEIGATVADAAGAELVTSLLVNEGGGIQVDGEGTVILTETVQLDQRRNPYLSRERVEAELARTIGATAFIWLPQGLTRDYEPGGTRGHVDMVAAFAAPGRVLLHWQNDPAHPDYAVVRRIRAVLESAHDAAGRELEIVELPAPVTLRDAEGFVDWNYANHLVVNGGVIACAYVDASDDRAAGLLAEAYDREVVAIDARPILARGGGIHCISQQQPSVPAATS